MFLARCKCCVRRSDSDSVVICTISSAFISTAFMSRSYSSALAIAGRTYGVDLVHIHWTTDKILALKRVDMTFKL